MAGYAQENLVTIATGASPQLTGDSVHRKIHHYCTGDAAATVEGANYFDPAAAKGIIGKGDTILACMVQGGVTVNKTYQVTSVSAAFVTVIAAT